MYLRVVSDNDKRRSHPTYNFHAQPQQQLDSILREEATARSCDISLRSDNPASLSEGGVVMATMIRSRQLSRYLNFFGN
jgi:hypothetical protein